MLVNNNVHEKGQQTTESDKLRHTEATGIVEFLAFLSCATAIPMPSLLDLHNCVLLAVLILRLPAGGVSRQLPRCEIASCRFRKRFTP